MSTGHLDQLLLGLADAPLAAMPGAARIVVSGLALDSRKVRRGDAFLALRGTQSHGIQFAAGAVQRGAEVVLAEGPAIGIEPLDVPVLWIDGLHGLVGEIAARFHGRPSEALRVIGVTGTNGKTSTVQLLAQALTFLGHRAASIGTLGAGLHGRLREGERTTPDAISVHGLLAEFRDAGASHVAMEVSSHALEQGRVGAVDFEVAAFTNLTRDHLDYHGSMEAYGAAKAKLFAWPGLRAAVINGDDEFGAQL
ncbi:MAG TPA: Mur ligase family protein, partial [Rhodanobacter sp.]